MTRDPRRQLIATAIIGLSVCLGGSLALVGPAKKALRDAHARAAALSAQLKEAEAARNDMALYTSALERAREQAKAISAAGAMARDERQLFSAIMASAAAHRIRVDQLNPAKLAAPPAPAAPGAPPEGGARDAAVAYSITAIGSYGDLAAFLRALRSEMGFSTVRSVRLVPSNDDLHQSVRALIETTHYAFDPGPPAPDGPRLSEAGGGQ